MVRERIYSIADLQARLIYWTRLLRLQDWEITVDIVSTAAMGGDYAGEIWPYPLKKRARIYILKPEDYCDSMARGKMTQPHDMEYTLVHELVHLSIYCCTVKYDMGTPAELLEEQAVHALTMGLLELDGRTQS